VEKHLKDVDLHHRPSGRPLITDDSGTTCGWWWCHHRARGGSGTRGVRLGVGNPNYPLNVLYAG
jgi:hypothetical protein